MRVGDEVSDLIGDAAKRTKPPRQCEECGSDRWRARDAEMHYAAASRMKLAATKMARQLGEVQLRVEVLQDELEDIRALMQRKIIRQSRVIRRMENRLRDLGKKPYEGAPLGEAAPGAEYDAGQAT